MSQDYSNLPSKVLLFTLSLSSMRAPSYSCPAKWKPFVLQFFSHEHFLARPFFCYLSFTQLPTSGCCLLLAKLDLWHNSRPLLFPPELSFWPWWISLSLLSAANQGTYCKWANSLHYTTYLGEQHFFSRYILPNVSFIKSPCWNPQCLPK